MTHRGTEATEAGTNPAPWPLWLCGFLLACAPTTTTTPPPQDPRAIVKADIARAEDAELHRKHDVARTEYERALVDAKDPHTAALARREYAETLGTWGETAKAVGLLERAVELAPADPAAWNDLGVFYHLAGNDGKALAALEKSKALAPRDWRPRRQLAMLLVVMHDYDRAEAEYRAMLDLDLPDRLRAAVHKALELLAAQPRTS